MGESEIGPMAGGRRRRRPKHEIMERLLAAAEEEFKAAGYLGGTTAAIARRAEITEAQLFRYFPSKAALFRRAMVKPLDDHFQDFMARQGRTANAGGGGFTNETRAYIGELLRFLSDHQKMFLSLFSAEAYPPGGIAGVTGVDSLHEYFEHGARTLSDHLADSGAIDPKLSVRVSFAAVLACVIFRDWLFPDDLASEAEVRDAIMHFVLHGLADGRAAPGGPVGAAAPSP